jgi:hypothetical protein
MSVDGLQDNEETNDTWSNHSLSLQECDVIVTNLEPSTVQLLNTINDGLLSVSDSHIHLVKQNGLWKLLRTYELSVGDSLVNEDGIEVEITKIGLVNGTSVIYDLGVEENDLYIANGILTHNK